MDPIKNTIIEIELTIILICCMPIFGIYARIFEFLVYTKYSIVIYVNSAKRNILIIIY